MNKEKEIVSVYENFVGKGCQLEYNNDDTVKVFYAEVKDVQDVVLGIEPGSR